jgi:hypothetical protein
LEVSFKLPYSPGKYNPSREKRYRLEAKSRYGHEERATGGQPKATSNPFKVKSTLHFLECMAALNFKGFRMHSEF